MIIRTVLLAILVMTGIAFMFAWRRAVRSRQNSGRWPSPIQLAIGFISDFLDTLGIGSFATTTAAYKLFNIVRDEQLVGTMIIGHSIPVVAQALIFIAAVEVGLATAAVLLDLGIPTLVLIALAVMSLIVASAVPTSPRRREPSSVASARSR